MGDDATGSGKSMFEPVAAATRSAGTTRFVCPVGWSTRVFELSGAAAAVWSVLDGRYGLDELADRCGVPTDDDLLTQAITLLTDAELIRETDPGVAG